jgi:hypothetical protein
MSIRTSKVSFVAIVAVLASIQAVEAKSKCVLAGGEATMVTEDLAKFMAGAALKNSISANGWKAAGAVKMTCKTNGLTHCVARQRACG